MTRPVYTKPTDTHLGFWRVYDPDARDIERLLRAARKEWLRFLIHGEPCEVSPEWADRHPGEAAEGVATYPYASHVDSWNYSLDITVLFAQTGDPGDYGEMLSEESSFATNFANVLIGADTENCWKTVHWIDIVDV